MIISHRRERSILDAVTTLLSTMSIEEIILTVILLAVSVKFLGELFEWCYNKLKGYFHLSDVKEERHKEIMESLNNLQRDMKDQKEIGNQQQKQIDKISSQLDGQGKESIVLRKALENQTEEITTLQGWISMLNERVQDSTRAYLIDRHHHFCYQIKGIDDMSLQDLERRFMYYKAAGGDTFIDDLMKEVRALPRLTLEHMSGQIRKEN